MNRYSVSVMEECIDARGVRRMWVTTNIADDLIRDDGLLNVVVTHCIQHVRLMVSTNVGEELIDVPIYDGTLDWAINSMSLHQTPDGHWLFDVSGYLGEPIDLASNRKWDCCIKPTAEFKRSHYSDRMSRRYVFDMSASALSFNGHRYREEAE